MSSHAPYHSHGDAQKIMNHWQNFLKNLGEWRGSFTRLSSHGEILGSTPSILTLEAIEDDQLVRFRLRRYDNPDYQDPPSQDYSQDYRSLGRQAIFFDTGAFSKGPWQVAPFTMFGVEFGFVAGDRRFRFVQLYDKALQLDSLTLIREFRQGSSAVERPPLTLEQFNGTWRGHGVTAYPDWRDPVQFDVEWVAQAHGDRLDMITTLAGAPFKQQGHIQEHGIEFPGTPPHRLTLLPDGGFSYAPIHLPLRQPFFVEVGWLTEDNERQRLIRHYDERGAWASATWISDRRCG